VEPGKRRLVNYSLLVISGILIIFTISLWMNKPLKVETMDLKFMVGDTVGIDLNPSGLIFGRVIQGGEATRSVIVDNDYDFDVRLKILVSKDLADYVYTESQLIIPAKESIQIPISLKVPQDIMYGNYSGKIKFEFRRKLF